MPVSKPSTGRGSDRLNADAIVDAAVELIDEQGTAEITLAAVAARLGVATPSLYKHLDGLADLRARLSNRTMAEMTAHFTDAALGRSGDDAVRTLLHAYRDYVVRHPGRYAAMSPQPLRDPAQADAGHRLIRVFLAVLRDYHLTDAEAIHATRCARAIVHGFTYIETGGGFGLSEDLDETFDKLVAMYLASLHRP